MIAIPKGTGPDPGGLVRYSFGHGKGNEHEHQRTVAGNCHSIQEGQVTREAVEQVAADLRVYQQMWGKELKDGHIYHVVISLNPGDRAVSDAEWKTICEDYMTARGITDPRKADVRWTAINHGRNEAGADHVHLAISLVRADGTKVSTWQDQPRSRDWAIGAEQRYGLAVTESRRAGVGTPGITQGEHAKAKDDGREPVRVRLADAARPIAAAATSELDYVQRLRAAGLDPKPRIDKTTHKITGYSIALDGQRFGAGKVAPDLALPLLRRVAWDDSNNLAAAQEWAHPSTRREPAPPTADVVRVAVGQLERDLWRAPVMTVDEHRAWSAQAAGLTAAAAQAATDPAVRAELQTLSRDLGRWAGPTDSKPPQVSRRAAQIIATALGGNAAGDRTSPDDGALLDAAGSVARIASMHQATRPAAAEGAQVARRTQEQQAAIARTTVAPGYYQTDHGDVVRVKRARAGHTYAATRDADTGKWRPGKTANLIAAGHGVKMTPQQVAAWEKTITPTTPAPTAVPVQPAAVRPAPRRQPTIRLGR